MDVIGERRELIVDALADEGGERGVPGNGPVGGAVGG